MCSIWSTTDVFWMNKSAKWSECSGSIPIPPPPIENIVLQPFGVDATTLIQPWLIEAWNPYKAGEIDRKKKRLIKLICKVKGQTYMREKEVGDMKISIEDIKTLIKTVEGIDLNVGEIK